MSLLETANQLAGRVAEYQRVREQASAAGMFETRAAQISGVAQRLGGAAAKLSKLRGAGIAVGFVLAADDKLRSRNTLLRDGFEQDPTFVDEPGFDLRFEYTAPALGVEKSAEEACLNAWQAYVRAHSEPVSREILAALQAVPEYRSTVAVVDTCQGEIETLAATIPEDPKKSAARLSELVEQQQEAWKKLTGGDVPRDVVLFLRACMGPSGAELRLLTPAVLDWLKERAIENTFRIKPVR